MTEAMLTKATKLYIVRETILRKRWALDEGVSEGLYYNHNDQVLCRYKSGNCGIYILGKSAFTDKDKAVEALIEIIKTKKHELAMDFTELCQQEKGLLNE